jgi:hypothetical protein
MVHRPMIAESIQSVTKKKKYLARHYEPYAAETTVLFTFEGVSSTLVCLSGPRFLSKIGWYRKIV